MRPNATITQGLRAELAQTAGGLGTRFATYGGVDVETLSVADVMTKQLFTAQHNDSLGDVAELMRSERVRHVPVLDEDGALVGIITQRDLFHSGLLKALGYGTHGVDKVRGQLQVKEVMRSSPVTTSPIAPLREAAQMMLDLKLGCLPVTDGGKLVGILTEGDFVALAARGAMHLV